MTDMQELIAQLVKQLKIDEQQAQGGAAVLFNAAKQKLGAAEFERMLGSVPGLDALMKKAPARGGMGSLLGGLASMAGGNAALLATVVGGFSKLKLSTGQARQFLPLILEHLRSQVGPDVVSRLEKTLRA